jgi:hypothetical protein
MPSIRTGAIGDGLIQHGPQRSDGHAWRRERLPDGVNRARLVVPDRHRP